MLHYSPTWRIVTFCGSLLPTTSAPKAPRPSTIVALSLSPPPVQKWQAIICHRVGTGLFQIIWCQLVSTYCWSGPAIRGNDNKCKAASVGLSSTRHGTRHARDRVVVLYSRAYGFNLKPYVLVLQWGKAVPYRTQFTERALIDSKAAYYGFIYRRGIYFTQSTLIGNVSCVVLREALERRTVAVYRTFLHL